ncbi:MAG TPA: hypothetical protein DCQ93_05485 [Bacteroidetes bacterium]|nr:hypothetical protein [Bacteroidota bacterium]
MKKLILTSALLFFTISIYAQTQLKNFDQLMNALKAGKDVRAVIHYGKCELYSEGVKEDKSPDAIGGMKFDTYEYFDSSVFKGKIPSFVTTSQTVLINHPKYGYVFNYVKIKIRIDGSVEISARYLKQKKFSSRYKVVMDETFKGKINDGSNDGAIFFYSN